MSSEETKVLNGQLCHPFSMLVAGSSLSGKTSFVTNLIQNRESHIDQPIHRIYWCYGQYTKELQKLKSTVGEKLKLIEGLPDNLGDMVAENDSEIPLNSIIVLDDLVHEVSNSEQVAKLFTQGVHHLNVSVICIIQDIFYSGGKFRKTLLRYAHYLSVFKSTMDMSLIDLIGRKVMPRQQKLFAQLFDNATKEPFSYLFISGHPKSPPELRFRCNLFGDWQRVFLTSTHKL